jgi:hypothetical protein
MGLLHACGGPPPHPANDGCPDTHPKDAPNPCDTIGPRSNNLMDYNEQQMHITAQQMGRMHFYLAGERGTIHRTLYQRYWQRYHPERPTRLTDTVALKGLRRYPGDVIVGRHALLRVHDSITLPPGAELRIERGGRLELMNGAAIACGKPGGRWRGIVYSGHPQQARQRRAIVIGAASRVHDARMPYRCRRGSSYTAYSPTLRR